MKVGTWERSRGFVHLNTAGPGQACTSAERLNVVPSKEAVCEELAVRVD